MQSREIELAELVAKAGAFGERTESVVFTNGCFDPLHHGHITMLREARDCGGLLVVGINSDESVRRIKGADRPRYRIDDRIQSLLDLRTVDYVISFDDDTPLPLLRKLRPDVLVKGGDYKVEQIVGSEVVLDYGGRVIRLGYVPGVSSTRLTSNELQGKPRE